MTEEGLLQVWVVEKQDKRRLHGEIDMRVVKLTPETVNYHERVELRGQRCPPSQSAKDTKRQGRRIVPDGSGNK